LLSTESVPVAFPEELGEKVTLIGQFADGARLGPQVLLSAKFAVAAMLVMFSMASP
jgi:hypothetical protein